MVSRATALAPSTASLSSFLRSILVVAPGLAESPRELARLSSSIRTDLDVDPGSQGLEGIFADMVTAGVWRLRRTWNQERSSVADGIRESILAASNWTGPIGHRGIITLPREALKELGIEDRKDKKPPVPKDKLTFYSWADEITEGDLKELDEKFTFAASPAGLEFSDDNALEVFYRQWRTKNRLAKQKALPTGWQAEARTALEATPRNLRGFARRNLLEQLEQKRQEAAKVLQWRSLVSVAAELQSIPTGKRLKEIVDYEKAAVSLIERGTLMLAGHRANGGGSAGDVSAEYVGAHYRPRRNSKKLSKEQDGGKSS